MDRRCGVFVFVLVVHVNCEIYTSIQRLTALAEMENKLFVDFENFLQRAEVEGAVIPEKVVRYDLFVKLITFQNTKSKLQFFYFSFSSEP
jgi:hypothetical protein